MSAYVVENELIAALVQVSKHGPAGVAVQPGWWHEPYQFRGVTSQDLGQKLLDANRASVAYRYGGDLCGNTDPEFRSGTYLPPIGVGQALGLLDCYEYQSCERPDWEQSDVHTWVEQMRHSLIHLVDGYTWSV